MPEHPFPCTVLEIGDCLVPVHLFLANSHFSFCCFSLELTSPNSITSPSYWTDTVSFLKAETEKSPVTQHCGGRNPLLLYTLFLPSCGYLCRCVYT